MYTIVDGKIGPPPLISFTYLKLLQSRSKYWKLCVSAEDMLKHHSAGPDIAKIFPCFLYLLP